MRNEENGNGLGDHLPGIYEQLLPGTAGVPPANEREARTISRANARAAGGTPAFPASGLLVRQHRLNR
jgi:hypothetical protein